MEPLFAVPWLRVAQIHVTDLERRAKEARGGIQHDSVTPTDPERVDVRLGLGSSRAQLVLPRLRICGDQTLELADEKIDFRTSEQRRHDHEALFVESTKLIGSRASTDADLLYPIGADLDPHRTTMPHDRPPAIPDRRLVDVDWRVCPVPFRSPEPNHLGVSAPTWNECW